MSKIKIVWNNVFDVIDGFLAYILTILGIVISAYIPLLKSTNTINITIDWWRIGISAVVALVIIGKQESLDTDENGSKDKSKAGRKKRFASRMTNAVAQGIMWDTLINLASK
jgi:hypothetical protein